MEYIAYALGGFLIIIFLMLIVYAADARAEINIMKIKIDMQKNDIKNLQAALKEARKNDYRDEKGRFKKAPNNNWYV